MIDRKPLIWLIVVAFGFAWPLFLAPLAFTGADAQTRQIVTLGAWAAAMFGPGIAALIATLVVAREPLRTLGIRRLGPKRTYLWAWLVPPLLAALAGLITVALGIAAVDPELKTIRQLIALSPGWSTAPIELVIAVQLLSSIAVAPLINLIPSLGEELGWRAFLLPRLLPLGQARAILLSGVIWGVWHWPVILQGHNYPTQPVLGMFLMIVFCVLLGAVLSWLYLRTRSAWAPALGHASVNASAGLAILFLGPVDITFGGTIVSVAGLIALAIFVAWLVWTRRLPVAEALPLTLPSPAATLVSR